MATPQYYYQSVAQVTPEWLAARGFSGLIVDLDNTVLPRYTEDLPQEIRDWAATITAAGVPVALLSNNHKKRVTHYAQLLGFIPLANGAKPLPFGYLRALRTLKLRRKQVVMLGDQLFTDILGAAVLGIANVMVEPLSHRDLAHTLLLRKLTRLVMGDRSAEAEGAAEQREAQSARDDAQDVQAPPVLSASAPPNAQTERRFAVLGTPIKHSLSAILHAAVFRATDLPWATELIDPESDEGFLRFTQDLRAQAGGYCGANVTIPYKEQAFQHCDELTSVAQACGAVNTLTSKDGRLIGDNTDAGGFLAALRQAFDLEAGDLKSVVICGTGGVARALAAALAGAGVPEITVASRTVARAADLVAALSVTGKMTVWQAGSYEELPQRCAPDERFDLFINATPIGMTDDDLSVLPLSWARERTRRVFDVVYRKGEASPLVLWAREQGLPATDGLQMLIEQAALSLLDWGVPAAVDELRVIMKQALADEGISR